MTATAAPAAYEDLELLPLGGDSRPGSSHEARADTDPCNGETLLEIRLADLDHLETAYGAAGAAQRMGGSAAHEWAAVMRAAADVLQNRKEEVVGWLVVTAAARSPKPSSSGAWCAR